MNVLQDMSDLLLSDLLGREETFRGWLRKHPELSEDDVYGAMHDAWQRWVNHDGEAVE